MPLKLYNTLTRQKEEFIPLEDKKVGFYSCGPTVYDYAHIGNLRTYIFNDILKRVLLYNGYKVKHVMNITDVGHLTSDADTGEDKMEKGARRERKTAWEIALFYTQAFKEDIKRLNIIEPDILCRATDHINEQIELIKQLANKGYTYIIEGEGVYFETSKFSDYGKLARLDIKGLEAGARVEMIPGKRNPTDFALWKFSPKDRKRDMEWDSPWGRGFPGWHIECSAMSLKYLGNVFKDSKLVPEQTKTIDIHTGGIDHIPIHHTNEIAQSEAATGKKFVNFWLHGEFLTLDEGRMGKSEGNIIILKDLIDKGFTPLAYRYLCLTAHYRSKLSFNWQNLEAAQNALDNLYEIISTWDEPRLFKKTDPNFETKFLEIINNDLDMPGAIALVWELVKSDLPSKVKKATLLKFDQVFGLGFNKIKKKKARVPKEVWDLIYRREEARKNKEWGKADELRKEVEKKGFLIEDTKEGPRIKIKD